MGHIFRTFWPRPVMLIWMAIMPCAYPLLGQTAAATQAPTPEVKTEVKTEDAPAMFKSKVNLVLVPVVVRDRDHKTVGTLRQEDFQLYDKGKLQAITKFSVEKTANRVLSTAPSPLTKDPTQAATAETAPVTVPEHFFAYLFDDVHLEFGNLAQVRDAAWKHLSNTLKPTDRAAIYTTSGQTMLDFTDDRDKLHATLLKLQPRSITRTGGQDCPDVSYYMADLIQNKNDPTALNVATQETLVCANLDPTQIATARMMAQSKASQVLAEGEHETRVSLSVLNDIVRRVTASPGQRTIILVSPGFIRTNDQLQEETAIIDRAIRGNVTISALDARGLYTDTPDISKRAVSAQTLAQKQQFERESARQSSDVMAELADGTGGTFVQNTNDLETGFKDVAAAPETFYVLGFSPQNMKLDGSYHVLKVSLKGQPGLTAKARRGYYAPRHLTDADEEAKEEISQALFSRDEMNDIPVDLHTQFFKTSATAAQLAVTARIDVRKLHFRKADGRNDDDIVVVSGLFDRNGNYLQGVTKKITMKLKDETLATKLNGGMAVRSDFKIAPGTYVIRLVVRDAEGQMMAARNGAIEIPY
jgi:VWFA-related protein